MTDNDTLQSNTVPTDPLIMDNMTEFNRVLSTQQARIVACHVRSSQSEQSMLGYTAAAAVMVTPMGGTAWWVANLHTGRGRYVLQQ
jgi:hypothetical protein